MNQKDYKEIAKILRLSNNYRELFFDLADYFERESKTTIQSKDGLNRDISIGKVFNRKQFLKDCGVE